MSEHDHDGTGQLVRMANDIGNFFRSETDRKQAVAGIANHISKFWTPRMRQKIAAYVQANGDGELDELPRDALRSIAVQKPAANPHEPPGGDAG